MEYRNESFDEACLRHKRRDLAIGLDREFHWSEEDRRAIEILGPESGSFPDRLRRLINPSYVPVETHVTPQSKFNYWVWIGFILLLLLGKCGQAVNN